MQERKIEIKGINPVELFGVNNVKLKHLKTYFPTLKIVARGNVVTINGEPEIMDEFEVKFDLILEFFDRFNALTESNIDNLMLEDKTTMLSGNGSEILVHGNSGVKIKARTHNQRQLVLSVNKNDMVFAVGPAGTGKTYTAVACAVRALKAKEVRRIILTRPETEPKMVLW